MPVSLFDTSQRKKYLCDFVNVISIKMLIFVLLFAVVAQLQSTCVLRMEDIDMSAFVVQVTEDIVTSISVQSIDDVQPNELACDLSDPEFLSSLTLAYNKSDIASILSYAKFMDSLNSTVVSMERLLSFTNKETISFGELSTLIGDVLMVNYNRTKAEGSARGDITSSSQSTTAQNLPTKTQLPMDGRICHTTF